MEPFTDQPHFPRAIRVKIFYDLTLQAITEKEMEEAWISEGMPFLLFLNIIFSSYPQIQVLHPPGVLGFAVNGLPPAPTYILQDADIVEFVVHEEGREIYENLFGY
jgi:hypothetical protein